MDDPFVIIGMQVSIIVVAGSVLFFYIVLAVMSVIRMCWVLLAYSFRAVYGEYMKKPLSSTLPPLTVTSQLQPRRHKIAFK